jgi:prepilin-type N-terminal cleavage/methylation domain-containing protein
MKPLSPLSRGFTLIELLVVISIISLLSSVVISAVNSARLKGYDAVRAQNLVEVGKALNAYYADNGFYPVPNGNGGVSYGTSNFAGHCNAGGGVAQNSSMYTPPSTAVNPLIPNYIATLPTDPKENPAFSVNTCCYLYTATANDFKFKLTTCPMANGAGPTNYLKDPNSGDVNGWAVYTPGASTW